VADIDARNGVIGWLGGPYWAWPGGPHPVFYLSGAAASAKGRNEVQGRRVASRLTLTGKPALTPCCTAMQASCLDARRRQYREITHQAFNAFADKMHAYS
jgi:hypothetical protein